MSNVYIRGETILFVDVMPISMIEHIVIADGPRGRGGFGRERRSLRRGGRKLNVRNDRKKIRKDKFDY